MKTDYVRLSRKIILIPTMILGAFSIIFLLESLITYDYCNSKFTLTDLYAIIGKYSGMYKFLFVCVAAYVGLEQINQTKKENKKRWEKEAKSETLKHCDYYLNDIQRVYKDLLDTNLFNGVPIKYDLTAINREALEMKYPHIYKKISDNDDKEIKSKVLITLYQLDSYAARFLYGNLDNSLGKQLIGYLYCLHIDLLMGVIAYYKPKNSNEKLFMNILKLKAKWE
jgi:hypothetical protein